MEKTSTTNCINSRPTHSNYVVGFSDGTAKIGTTKRGQKRVDEIVKNKIREQGNVTVLSSFISEPRQKEEAYRIERDTCYMERRRAIPGHREWFYDTARSIEQTYGMFAHGVGINRAKRKSA